MIVISGALVLVALVLLILGVVGPDLAFVYASIGVSLVSLGFLVVGILQRRDEPADELAAGPATEPAARPTTEPTTAPTTQPAPVHALRPEAGTDGDQGQAVRPSSVRRAPDPAARTGAVEVDQAGEDEAPAAATLGAPPATGGTVLVVEGRPRYHVAGCRYLSGKAPEAVEVGQARDDGFTPCGVCKPELALAAPAQGSSHVPGASAPLPVAPARTAPARGGSVVVIPERGRYHRETCRYVRDVGGAEVLSRTAATRQGFVPCGVCKP